MNHKRLIVDLDNTICTTINGDYINSIPNRKLIDKLFIYKTAGFTITIFTSRNMRTFNGNIKLIESHTLPIIKLWLESNLVPYDEIIVGKPWCGLHGFYIDDRAVRPSEFIENDYNSLSHLMNIS